MPQSKNIQIILNNQIVDIGDIDDLADNLEINYVLEDPDSWQTIQASQSFDCQLPATKNNDKIFNTFYNATVEDLSPDSSYRELMDITINVNGSIAIMKGKYILSDVTITDKPESYTGSMYSGNGDWLIDMQNVTLWDCLNTQTHTFDVSTTEASWDNFDSDEFHDYVYAPVRYRQPFTTNNGPDDTNCNIYQLRPSISIYWILIRGFRQFGYKINSQFLETSNYFRKMVMPWTWGDFYDINNQIVESYSFKASGDINEMTTNEPPPNSSSLNMWTGSGSGSTSGSTHGSDWKGLGFTLVGNHYIFSDGINNHFNLNNTQPPDGADNFGVFFMQEFAGTYPAGSMVMTFDYPSTIAPYIGTNISLTFVLDLLLYCSLQAGIGGATLDIQMEVTHIPVSGPTVVTSNSILPFGVILSGETYPNSIGYPLSPTVYNFTVPNVNKGDVLQMRIKSIQLGTAATYNVFIAQSGYLNANPSVLGVNQWQYNPTTGLFANYVNGNPFTIWQPIFSSLKMTGFLLQIGNQVNFRQYDSFRNYRFLDLLVGLSETWNLEIQTDPINKTITIEPMFGSTIQGSSPLVIDGYFSESKVNDWTNKRDKTKPSKLSLYKTIQRQLDFTFKQDGNDGGQNIYAARYLGIYLNNVIKPTLNNTNIENGVIAGVPGASRYMLPNRFSKGNKQISNQFFSSTMHYIHSNWGNIVQLLSGSPISPLSPQLICIFPENINDSSASAITQIFEPKIAYYSGRQSVAAIGGWRWSGDPVGRGYDADGLPIPTYNSSSDVVNGQPLSSTSSIGFELPYMYAVDYSGIVASIPGNLNVVLTYCDQNINGSIVNGLMNQFFLKRLAIYRNGQLYNSIMRLNLNDICNFEHQECIIIDKSLYALISIDNYKPLKDETCNCILWKVVNPMQVDLDNSYPSSDSVLNSPLILSQFDLRYSRLLLFYTDIPIV